MDHRVVTGTVADDVVTGSISGRAKIVKPGGQVVRCTFGPQRWRLVDVYRSTTVFLNSPPSPTELGESHPAGDCGCGSSVCRASCLARSVPPSRHSFAAPHAVAPVDSRPVAATGAAVDAVLLWLLPG
jgi:hypothetical protein